MFIGLSADRHELATLKRAIFRLVWSYPCALWGPLSALRAASDVRPEDKIAICLPLLKEQ